MKGLVERTSSVWLVSKSPGTADLLSSIGCVMPMSRYSDTMLLRLGVRAGVTLRHN